MTNVERLLALLPPRASDRRLPFLLGIDGRSGAGKTALATELAERREDVIVLALEDAYRGWWGLREGLAEMARGVLAPLSQGRAGSYRRYDWHRGELGGQVDLTPPKVLVVEGCGAGSALCRPYLDTLVWLFAPVEVRRSRALARDVTGWADHWEQWAAQEDALLAEDDAAAAADLVLSTAEHI